MSTDDGVKLWRDFGLHANGLVELGMIASQADPENPFLQKNGRPYLRKGIVALAKVRCLSVSWFNNTYLQYLEFGRW